MNFSDLGTWVGLAAILGVGLTAFQANSERKATRERERERDRQEGIKMAEAGQVRKDLDRAHEKISKLEETQQADHELLIEIRNDQKHLVVAVEALTEQLRALELARVKGA